MSVLMGEEIQARIGRRSISRSRRSARKKARHIRILGIAWLFRCPHGDHSVISFCDLLERRKDIGQIFRMQKHRVALAKPSLTFLYGKRDLYVCNYFAVLVSGRQACGIIAGIKAYITAFHFYSASSPILFLTALSTPFIKGLAFSSS